VGLVTKYAGSVRKGFALIFGLLLSGILQSKGGEGVEKEQVVGGILAAISLWMYSSFPVAPTI
jgi:UDP-sugar transporter A1/2/3